MPRGVADGKLVLDQASDPPPGPDSPAKAEGFRATGQQSDELVALIGREQRGAAGTPLGTQGGGGLLRRAGQPLADRALRDAQGLGDPLLLPTLLMQFPGPLAPTLRPTTRVVWMGGAHTLSIPQTGPKLLDIYVLISNR